MSPVRAAGAGAQHFSRRAPEPHSGEHDGRGSSLARSQCGRPSRRSPKPANVFFCRARLHRAYLISFRRRPRPRPASGLTIISAARRPLRKRPARGASLWPARVRWAHTKRRAGRLYERRCSGLPAAANGGLPSRGQAGRRAGRGEGKHACEHARPATARQELGSLVRSDKPQPDKGQQQSDNTTTTTTTVTAMVQHNNDISF